MKPSYAELCRAIVELLAARKTERNVIYDQWMNRGYELSDEDTKIDIEEMDAEIARFDELIRRAVNG